MTAPALRCIYPACVLPVTHTISYLKGPTFHVCERHFKQRRTDADVRKLVAGQEPQQGVLL